MQNIIKIARNIVVNAPTEGTTCTIPMSVITELRYAMREYEQQCAKHADRPTIVMKKCLRLKAKDGKRTVEIIVEPGDKARIIGRGLDKLTVESADPSRLTYSVPYVDERVTWEYYYERGA